MTDTLDKNSACTRRQLLKHGVSASLLLLLPPLSVSSIAAGQWTPIGNAADFKLRRPKRIILAGGAAIYVTRLSPTKLVAISARCPHQGCEVGPAQSGNEYVCPCHGATFTSSGKNVRGPAKSPLTPIPVMQKGAKVLISAQAAKARVSAPVRKNDDDDDGKDTDDGQKADHDND